MDLDLRLSRVIMAVKLMERVLHEPAGWTIECGGREFPAVAYRGGGEVFLIAEVVGPLASSSAPLVLRHRGEVQGVREVEVPDVGVGEILTLRWTFQLEALRV